MTIIKSIRVPTSLFMAFLLTNLPAYAAIEGSEFTKTTNSMLSTSSVVAELKYLNSRENIHEILDQPQVQQELLKRGLKPDEIRERLASLNESELYHLSQEMNQARYGGDILITVLLVILIIYLFKRI